MAEIKRSALFGKLNTWLYRVMEEATVTCKMRGNPYVELIHWIHQIAQAQDSDFHRIIRHFNLDFSKLAGDMTASLEQLPRGATAISDFSPHILDAVERAWLYASLQFNYPNVRSGLLVYSLLETSSVRNVFIGISREFGKIEPSELAKGFSKITSGSPEDSMHANDGSRIGGSQPGESSGAMAPAQMGEAEALARFSVDLTEQAKGEEMDPILGRDEEIRQIVDILMRKRQNNPILTGEAGVGKTAVVEGFAQRIARGDVPEMLKDVTVRTLDLGLLQAGASMKGEFEERLRQVIEEVQSSPKPIILFIDEAHTLIGAGGAEGQGDAANLLKPALARGKLRTIAATTWAEYKKYFEKDPALTRRFQVVKIEEPDEAKSTVMIRGQVGRLEKHHKISILDEAVTSAVKLSHRYIPARQLPDKAVSLIDTSCARVSVSQHATPAEVEDTWRLIDYLTTELTILEREEAGGANHAERKAEINEQLEQEKARKVELEEKWNTEKELVEQITQVKIKIDEALRPQDVGKETEEAIEAAAEEQAETNGDKPSVGPEVLDQLNKLRAELAEVQGESPLIYPEVDANAVASVVADWTGIPVGRMVKNEIQAVLNLVEALEKRVLGQTHAMEAISKRIQTSRASLDNPNKPIGVFLLAGTSGVGKTETALALAETLYGGESNLITINMSEFQEAHTVSTLKGAPPGYVGYGEGGVLTEAVRRRPYSVVLLDEVEKAHSDVHEIFFQVFDKGLMEDGEGRMIDFKNTIILLTTNAGSDVLMNLCKDPELMPEPEALGEALREPLLQVFPAALLGRMLTIPYYPLTPEVVQKIIQLQLGRIIKRVRENHRVPLSYDQAVVDLIAKRCTELESGGRMIDAILTNTLLPAMSRTFLTSMMEGKEIQRVNITVKDGDFNYEF